MIMGGLLAKVLLERLKWRTYFLRLLARVHKYSAIFLMVFGQFCIMTGMASYQKMKDLSPAYLMLFWIHLIVHAVLFLALEIIFRLWRNKSGPLTSKEPSKTMTHDEYEAAVKGGM
jgi:tellurite resistance protein TehA-like permease